MLSKECENFKEKYLDEYIKVATAVQVTYRGVLSSDCLAFKFSSVEKIEDTVSDKNTSLLSIHIASWDAKDLDQPTTSLFKALPG